MLLTYVKDFQLERDALGDVAVNRGGNSVAHGLAQFAIASGRCQVSFSWVPECV
jgi:hypothetical protein